MTKKKYAPEIERHPWMCHVVANRPAGYKTVDTLEVHDLPRMSGRLNTLATKLRVQYERLASHDTDTLDVIGLEKLEAALEGVERGINVINDCVDQWLAYEYPEDAGA